MFHGFSLAREGKKFEKYFYKIKLPFLYWWKADKNLQSRRSKLIEVLLRYISENRSDHYSYRNFAYLFAILEDERTHFNNENENTYLNDREREEIQQTNSYKKAHNLFYDFEYEIDLSSTEFTNALEASFQIHTNKTLFGSKTIFRIWHGLDSWFLFSFHLTFLSAILIFALHFFELLTVLSSTFDKLSPSAFDSWFFAILGLIFTILTFIFLFSFTAVGTWCAVLLLPFFYEFFKGILVTMQLAGWFFDYDITLNVLFYSSLIYYLSVLYFLPKAFRGQQFNRSD